MLTKSLRTHAQKAPAHTHSRDSFGHSASPTQSLPPLPVPMSTDSLTPSVPRFKWISQTPHHFPFSGYTAFSSKRKTPRGRPVKFCTTVTSHDLSSYRTVARCLGISDNPSYGWVGAQEHRSQAEGFYSSEVCGLEEAKGKYVSCQNVYNLKISLF